MSEMSSTEKIFEGVCQSQGDVVGGEVHIQNCSSRIDVSGESFRPANDVRRSLVFQHTKRLSPTDWRSHARQH
jgi:hypothetical protein